MMGGQHTTYDSITKTTTKEEDATGMMPLVQQEEHETGGTLIEEGEVGAAAEDRRRVLVRRSMIQTRSVAALLVGAAVLLVAALSTMDFGGGIGSVGSLVSVRSTSRTDRHWLFSADDYLFPPEDNDYGYPPEDYDYDENVIEEDIILTAEELLIWRNENGISAQPGECQWCDAHNCRTGMPVLLDEHPNCNYGNYQCQYYTNCGNFPGPQPQPSGLIADESECQKCYYNGCATGRPTVSGDAYDREICKNNHCPEYVNCEHDFPCADYGKYDCVPDFPQTAQGGTARLATPRRGVYFGELFGLTDVPSRGKVGKSTKSYGVEEKTGRSSKSGKAY